MTETTIQVITVGVIAAIAPTLAALAAFRQGRINERKTDENTAITKQADHKADELITKVEVVRVATDGNLTALRSDVLLLQQQLTDAYAQIQTLHALVQSMVEAGRTAHAEGKREGVAQEQQRNGS